MNDITYKKLNGTETISKSLPKIIEAFSIFYGESEREVITEKFNNVLILGYVTPETTKDLLIEAKKQKSNELIEKFLNKLDIPIKEHPKFKKIFFNDQKLDKPQEHPINAYVQYKNGDKTEKRKNEVFKFLKQLFPSIKETDKFISPIKKQKLNKILKIYKDILSEYDKYLDTIKKQEEYLEKCAKLKKELEIKYTSMLIDEFEYLFSDKELKQIKEKNKNAELIPSANRKSENYFGRKLNSKALIDAFSIESEEILNGTNTWRINSIIKDRIKFFKNLGIEVKDSYEGYINNEDIKRNILIVKHIASKLITRRKELYNQMINEYYMSIEEYKKNLEIIGKSNLLDKNHAFSPIDYENDSSYVSPNLKKTELGIIMYPILCFSINYSSKYIDAKLIHELNHIYELSLESIDKNKYTYTCGWERITTNYGMQEKRLDSNEKTRTKREYKLFNEIINELISQEITEILFSLDGYIFNNKDDAKIQDGTSYEDTLFLVKDFYNKYKKEIIESRRTGDMTILFDTIGKHNFDLLNELINEFYELFPEISIYGLKNSLRKKEDTEQTKKYYELIIRRDNILKSMEEYQQQKRRSL